MPHGSASRNSATHAIHKRAKRLDPGAGLFSIFALKLAHTEQPLVREAYQCMLFHFGSPYLTYQATRMTGYDDGNTLNGEFVHWIHYGSVQGVDRSFAPLQQGGEPAGETVRQVCEAVLQFVRPLNTEARAAALPALPPAAEPMQTDDAGMRGPPHVCSNLITVHRCTTDLHPSTCHHHGRGVVYIIRKMRYNRGHCLHPALLSSHKQGDMELLIFYLLDNHLEPSCRRSAGAILRLCCSIVYG